MDYFAHGIWSYIFFHWIKKPWKAVAFGLVPDTLSWVILFFYNLFLGNFHLGAPDAGVLPEWIFLLYDVSHSLFVSFLVIGLIWIVLKKFPIYALAWPLAITFDFLTHKREFLPTPFLWPVSDWKFDGIDWATPEFMIANYILIVICLSYIYLKKKGKL